MRRLKTIVRGLITFGVTVVAALMLWQAWRFYAYSPWTRDGRVRVLVVSVAPEVSGKIVQLNVRDNQYASKGDVLFVIDPESYEYALENAKALVESTRATMEMAKSNLTRAEKQTNLSITAQQREQAYTNSQVAVANYEQALAGLKMAKLNMERTRVRATVDGPITNLQADIGHYASAGSTVLAQVNANSFYVYGYFEETRLRYIKKNDRVSVRLMGYEQPLVGHVRSIAPIITDSNNTTSSNGVADVSATFTWVRLAQRIPVHVAIDMVPATVSLSSGMTTTVVVENNDFQRSIPPYLRQLLSNEILAGALPFKFSPPPDEETPAPDGLYPLVGPQSR